MTEQDLTKTEIIQKQGCCLPEDIRLQYLKDMGIQSWSLKFPSAIESEIPSLDIHESQLVEPASVEAREIATELKSVSTDISSFGWEQLQQAVSQCQLCELHATRTRTVFGVGNPNADLMIIGDAPEDEDDRQGEPFLGATGELLDAMMKAIDLDRQKVYITNVLKCQPPDNRNPHTSETVCCDPYLQQQIKLVQPKLILALGRIAAHHLLVSQKPLAELRQQKHLYNGIPMRVSYHPAYLLRKPVEKRKSWQDLLEVKQLLKQ